MRRGVHKKSELSWSYDSHRDNHPLMSLLPLVLFDLALDLVQLEGVKELNGLKIMVILYNLLDLDNFKFL